MPSEEAGVEELRQVAQDPGGGSCCVCVLTQLGCQLGNHNQCCRQIWSETCPLSVVGFC